MDDFSRKRPRLSELDLSLGKRVRLHRILYEHGPANGTGLFLPIDQGMEHGPRDFFENPDSVNPLFQLEVARRGHFSAIVFQPGVALKYMKDYAGEVPLVMKITGKTEIPPATQPLSAMTGAVEDAVHAGADAVGYTLYVGSPRQDQDFEQFVAVRRAAEWYGMPVIMWAYPRGEAVDAKGGRDSFWAVHYAARVANELGADVVKVNMPVFNEQALAKSPKPYQGLELSPLEAMTKVCEAAGKTLVLVSGGGLRGEEKEVIEKARICMQAGCTGLIFGRNIWQRPMDRALALGQELFNLLQDFGDNS